MEGIFTPSEIAVLEELDGNEKMVLSIYKYYTEKGKYHCCTLTNDEIGKRIGRKVRQVGYIKSHLKELGFIRVSGNKVYYLTCSTLHTNPAVHCIPPCSTLHTNPAVHCIPPCSTLHTNPAVHCNHNNKKENKKEKKEEKESKTNFDQALDNLSNYYKTPDKIEYLKSNYGEYIDKINSIDEDLSIDSISKNIKNAIIKKFGVEPIEVIDIEKKESTGIMLI